MAKWHIDRLNLRGILPMCFFLAWRLLALLYCQIAPQEHAGFEPSPVVWRCRQDSWRLVSGPSNSWSGQWSVCSSGSRARVCEKPEFFGTSRVATARPPVTSPCVLVMPGESHTHAEHQCSPSLSSCNTLLVPPVADRPQFLLPGSLCDSDHV